MGTDAEMKTAKVNRRQLIQVSLQMAALPSAVALMGCSRQEQQTSGDADDLNVGSNHLNDSLIDPDTKSTANREMTMRIHYLEIVTKDVDAICSVYSQSCGVAFGEPQDDLGGARTTPLPDGALLGVRAPMHELEEPVVRPYLLVDDIESAVAAAKE